MSLEATPPTISGTMGISCHLDYLTNTQLSEQLALMAKAGVRWIRYDVTMDNIEPTDGIFDFSIYDNITTQATALGIQTIAIIAQYNVPKWALSTVSGATYPSNSAYQAFCQAVAAHYVGKINFFELGNEPNISEFWNTGCDPVAYTAFLKAGYTGIKAGNPNAGVMTAGLANVTGDVSQGIATGTHNYDTTNFLTLMYENGAHGYFDYLAIHPYTWPAAPNFSIINSCVSIMNSNGDTGKPVIITELGWPTNTGGGPNDYPVGNTEAQQATYITDSFEMIISGSYQFVPVLCIYDFVDDGTDPTYQEDNFGLVEADMQTIKPAYTAYQGVAAALATAPILTPNLPPAFSFTGSATIGFDGKKTFTTTVKNATES